MKTDDAPGLRGGHEWFELDQQSQDVGGLWGKTAPQKKLLDLATPSHSSLTIWGTSAGPKIWSCRRHSIWKQQMQKGHSQSHAF